MSAKGCLNCHHVRLSPPLGWKPAYMNDTFDVMNAAKVIRETKQHIKAECTLYPVWTPVLTNHYCGQWEIKRPGYEFYANVDQLLWGSREEKHIVQLAEENQELRRQLKKSRDISAGRLARLKNNGAASAEQDAT